MFPLAINRAFFRGVSGSATKLELVHTRTYITYELLQVLCKTPIGRLAAGSFAIQKAGLCVFNANEMHDRLIEALIDEGVLVRRESRRSDETQTHPKARWSFLNFWKADENRFFNSLVSSSRKFGPGVLTLQKMVEAPKPGEATYTLHHAAVLLFCFTYRDRSLGDRTIAVLLDGNDLQTNPAMSAVCDYLMKFDRKSRPLCSEPTQFQFDEISREASARDNKPLDVKQMGFRLVDFEEMVRGSELKYNNLSGWIRPLQGNSGSFNAEYVPSQPLLLPEVEKELTALLDQHPEVIERQFS